MVVIVDLSNGEVLAGAHSPETTPEPMREPTPEPSPITDDTRDRVARLCLWTNISISAERWAELFGRPDAVHPWGAHFWPGMLQLEAAYNRRPPHLSHQAASPGHFKAPLNFSKRSARSPSSPSNPRGTAVYAALFWRYDAEYCYMACQWQLVYQSRPWYVHIDWIQF